MTQVGCIDSKVGSHWADWPKFRQAIHFHWPWANCPSSTVSGAPSALFSVPQEGRVLVKPLGTFCFIMASVSIPTWCASHFGMLKVSNKEFKRVHCCIRTLILQVLVPFPWNTSLDPAVWDNIDRHLNGPMVGAWENRAKVLSRSRSVDWPVMVSDGRI